MSHSWFIGSERQPRLQHFLERVIQRIYELTGRPDLVFMGGSGGGFAALELSRRFGNSVVLVMNPQTDLSRYYPALVRSYLDLCWSGKKELSFLPSHVVHNVTGAYPKILTNTVAYLQNTRDTHHVENHQIPFFEVHGGSERIFTNMGAWGEPTGKGYVQPPKEYIKKILQGLVESKGDWSTALLSLGFSVETSPSAVLEAVSIANSHLPVPLVKDEM